MLLHRVFISLGIDRFFFKSTCLKKEEVAEGFALWSSEFRCFPEHLICLVFRTCCPYIPHCKINHFIFSVWTTSVKRHFLFQNKQELAVPEKPDWICTKHSMVGNISIKKLLWTISSLIPAVRTTFFFMITQRTLWAVYLWNSYK